MLFEKQNFLLKRRPSKSFVVACALGVVVVAMCGLVFYQSAQSGARLKSGADALLEEKNKVASLTAKLKAQEREAAIKLAAAVKAGGADVADLEGKVGAFAKQAAICETLRTAMHVK